MLKWFVLGIIICAWPLLSNGQKRKTKPLTDRPISIMTGFGGNVSFSSLTNQPDHRLSAPPFFALNNYGINLERQFFNDSFGLYLNTGLSSAEISVSSQFFFKNNTIRRAMSSSYQTASSFTVWNIGIKKIVRPTRKRRLKSDLEIGLRTHFSPKTTHSRGTWVQSDYLDTIVSWRFYHDYTRPVTIIPYLGYSLSFNYKSLKFGIQISAQSGFVDIIRYNYEVQYGSNFHYVGKSVSYGAAIGANLYIKLVSF